jgi:large subunit ribosomal protein L25
MELSVTSREITGKKVKTLRKEGLIPGELYGHGVKNVHVSVPAREFNKVFKEAGSTTVVTLIMEKEKRSAMIHEIARDYVTGDVVHVDFREVKMNEAITAKVPLEFTGEAPAVKEKGAVVNKSMSEIEVEALPADLPHSLAVDLSALDDLNKSIYVKDLVRPKGVKFLVDEETAVATATPPAPEEIEVKAEETVDVADVKVETEEKKVERQAEKAKEDTKEEKK